MDATLFQASLLSGQVELPVTDDPRRARREALKEAYQAGVEALEVGGRVYTEPGTYFLPDRTKVEGTIVRVGRIASYGVGQESGALVPAGEDKYQLRDTEAAAVAEALAQGGTPNPVGIFAYEDNGKRVEEPAEKTIWTTLEAGGIVGYVIVSLGIIGIVLSGLRAFTIFMGSRGGSVVTQALEMLDKSRWDEALNLAKQAPGSANKVLTAMLPLGPGDTKRLEDRASESILLETPAIERFGTAIIVIAAVAPLLGLLGTVGGMIGTFEIITEFGTGDPRMLSGGISEALVTTQLGLIVAIPTLLLGNLLNQAGESVLSGLETTALAVINRSGSNATMDPGEEPTHVGTDPTVEAPTHG